MQQYLRAKAEHPDCILLFRIGDFYETFYEDAVEVSQLLDIALTSRNKDDPNPVPMAGVPWHSVSGYIQRLVEAGRKVAIAEQMEDPKQAKGLVRREVVRVVTPGVLLDTELPDPSSANHLVCAVRGEREVALVALDASTGAFAGAVLTGPKDLEVALSRLTVREVLLPEGTDERLEAVMRGLGALVSPVPMPDLSLIPDKVRDRLPPAPAPTPLRLAGAAILSYLARTHPALLACVCDFKPLVSTPTITLPPSTIRNLELLTTVAGGRSHGSLFHFLNRTETAMGARLLRSWLLAPLSDPADIEARIEMVAALFNEPAIRARVRADLKGVADVERVLTRLAGGNPSARDLNALAGAAQALARAAQHVQGLSPFKGLAVVPEELLEVARDIAATFVPDPPPYTREGGMVRRGVNEELDRAVAMAEDGRRFIAEYEARERSRTGIAALKVRYNRVFGYTIEVPRSQQARVPPEYERRQTLAGAERYTTRELTELERQVGSAEERSRAIESEVFETFRQRVVALSSPFQALAQTVARLDALACLAELAHAHNWCRPRVTGERRIRLVAARHPIVEASLPAGTFVPNDYEMDGTAVTMDIITGPNMAGKSTLMRQVAIAVILAQMGSFVPAQEAEIGVVDGVWTRVGAMDDLAAGRSTFMVEMAEVAEMLDRATDRSLLILDEVGRGTSTFDGVAIAWAVAEHIQNKIGCRTLFATHYHELTELPRSVPRVRNLSIAVKEWGGEVLFLRRLVDGPASKSYGIQVARLAGLPPEVLSRAREVLANLEAGELDVMGQPVLARGKRKAAPRASQLELFATSPHPIVARLATLDPDRLTPIEALQLLADLAAEARKC